MSKPEYLSISPAEMLQRFTNILLPLGFDAEKAAACAKIFTDNSIDGIYTHGVNRFPVFVQYVKDGHVIPTAEPVLVHKFNGLEQWNGNKGPGPLNAIRATDRATELAAQYGIGCVALANTNHWMRGGYYGWHAAKAGCVFIGLTNTIGVMPAWGATDSRLGNNPFVMSLPYQQEAIVLDMAMSQYSFGAMELAMMKNEELAVYGGYNIDGELTSNPAQILESRRALPMGFWKGAGMSFLMDVVATILSGGMAGYQITESGIETNISQVFIAIDAAKLGNQSAITQSIHNIIQDYRQSVPAHPANQITYPGERVLQNRQRNMAMGIPVLQNVWDKIQAL